MLRLDILFNDKLSSMEDFKKRLLQLEFVGEGDDGEVYSDGQVVGHWEAVGAPPRPTLDEWLADWADECNEGRSHISRAEATRRYRQQYPE